MTRGQESRIKDRCVFSRFPEALSSYVLQSQIWRVVYPARELDASAWMVVVHSANLGSKGSAEDTAVDLPTVKEEVLGWRRRRLDTAGRTRNCERMSVSQHRPQGKNTWHCKYGNDWVTRITSRYTTYGSQWHNEQEHGHKWIDVRSARA